MLRVRPGEQGPGPLSDRLEVAVTRGANQGPNQGRQICRVTRRSFVVLSVLQIELTETRALRVYDFSAVPVAVSAARCLRRRYSAVRPLAAASVFPLPERLRLVPRSAQLKTRGCFAGARRRTLAQRVEDPTHDTPLSFSGPRHAGSEIETLAYRRLSSPASPAEMMSSSSLVSRASVARWRSRR